MSKEKITSKNKNRQIGLTLLFIVICFIVIVPFIMLVSVSLSNEQEILQKGYSLFPRGFELSAYKYVFSNSYAVFNAYKITITYSVIAMVLSVLLQSMLAYPLTSSKLKGKKFISLFLYFTMLFNGGLVPSYILITKYLHLSDTIWVYILPSLIGPWNVFMMRTFFNNIPHAMLESARIDGANEYIIYAKFVMPLSKPVLATIALFTFLGKWNDWATSMIYINDNSLISLQYLLQRIMENISMLQNASADVQGMMKLSQIPNETVRFAMAVVVAGPVILVFPFFQKYFVHGLTVGSVKG